MLKIVESIPKDTNWGRKSVVENDLVTFMKSGERYAKLTVPGKDGQKVKSLAMGWLRRRNVKNITTRVVDGVCYLRNEDVSDKSDAPLRAVM